MKASLYDTLEVDKTASSKEIKKAYLKKAREKHPDKTNGDSKEFQDVNHAYQVLSCPIKREHYDKTGSDEIIARERIIQAILKSCLNPQDDERVHKPIKRLEDRLNNLKQSKAVFSKQLIDIEADIEKLTEKSADFIHYYNGIVEMAQYVKGSIYQIDNEISVCNELMIEFESVKKVLGRDIITGDLRMFFNSSMSGATFNWNRT
jgi:curved DNA-binding protein CbpA